MLYRVIAASVPDCQPLSDASFNGYQQALAIKTRAFCCFTVDGWTLLVGYSVTAATHAYSGATGIPVEDMQSTAK